MIRRKMMGKKKHKYVSNPWDLTIDDQLRADDELYGEASLSLDDVLDKKDIKDKKDKFGLPKSLVTKMQRDMGIIPADYDDAEAAWDAEVEKLEIREAADEAASEIASDNTTAEEKRIKLYSIELKSEYGAAYIDARIPLVLKHPYNFIRPDVLKSVEYYIQTPSSVESSYVDDDLNVRTSRLLRAIISDCAPTWVLATDRFVELMTGRYPKKDVVVFGVEGTDGYTDVYIVNAESFDRYFEEFDANYGRFNEFNALPDLYGIGKIATLILWYESTYSYTRNYFGFSFKHGYREALIKESEDMPNSYFEEILSLVTDDSGEEPISKYTKGFISSEAIENMEEYKNIDEDDHVDTIINKIRPSSDDNDDDPQDFDDDDYEEIEDDDEDDEEDDPDEEDSDEEEEIEEYNSPSVDEIAELTTDEDCKEIKDNIDKMLDDSIENLASSEKSNLDKVLEPIHKKGRTQQ